MKLFRNAVAILSELSGLLPVLAAYALLVHLHPQLGLSPLLYLAYAAAFILLPAYACGRLLLQMDLGVAERVCLGFPISQALLFLLAWGGSRLGLSWWGALGLPVLGLYALWDLARTRGQWRRSEPFVLTATAAFTTVSLALCFWLFSQTALPGEGPPVVTYGDDAMMTMGTFSAVKAMLSGLPFMEGSFGDIPFTYHIMMQANNGVAHLVTGVHPLLLQLYIYPVLHWLMLAGAVVAGARRFAGFDRKQTVLAGCLMFYTSGTIFEAHPWLQMYGNYHTYFFDLAGCVVLGMLLFGVLSGRLARLPGIYFGFLFLGVCSAKGVPLLLVPLSLLPVLVYRLCQRKLCADDLKVSAGVLLSALVLRAIEYTSFGQIELKKFNILNSSMDVFVNFMEAAPFVVLAMIIAMQNRLVMHKVLKSRQYIIFAASMFIVSMLLTRAIDFVGGHQYFFWYFRLFFMISIAYCFGYAFEMRRRSQYVAVLALIAVAMSIFSYHTYSSLRIRNSIGNIFTLNGNEWNGLLWAYNNIDRNARISSNGAYGYYDRNGERATFGALDYLAVSGMYGYAWPSDWLPDDVSKVVAPRLAAANAFWKATSADEQQRLLAAIPVDYLFVRKREDRGLDYTGLAGVRRIYASEDFDIYALRGAAPQNERSADRAQ